MRAKRISSPEPTILELMKSISCHVVMQDHFHLDLPEHTYRDQTLCDDMIVLHASVQDSVL